MTSISTTPWAARVQLIALDKLHADPLQPRKTMNAADLAALEGSIRAVGVLQPIAVRGDEGRYIIVDGHCRCQAARAVGLTHVPALESIEALTEAQVSRQQLGSYCRSDLNPMDRAEAIERFMRLSQLTASAVAREMGLSEGHTSKLLALNLLGNNDKERVRQGLLGLAAAYRIATGKITASPPSVRLHKPPATSRKPAPLPLRMKLTPGVSLVAASPAKVPLDAMITVLGEVLSRLGRLQSAGQTTLHALNTELDTMSEASESSTVANL